MIEVIRLVYLIGTVDSATRARSCCYSRCRRYQQFFEHTHPHHEQHGALSANLAESFKIFGLPSTEK
jgi:hypothetical protein